MYLYTISSGETKHKTLQAPSSAPHLERWARYFRHKYPIKSFQNYMGSKIIESYQCSLERSHAVSVELTDLILH